MINSKKKKINIVNYKSGDLVEVSEGMLYYSSEWTSQNGLVPGTGRYFRTKVIGEFVKNSPDSGNLYKIIKIDGELFEVIHKQIKVKE